MHSGRVGCSFNVSWSSLTWTILTNPYWFCGSLWSSSNFAGLMRKPLSHTLPGGQWQGSSLWLVAANHSQPWVGLNPSVLPGCSFLGIDSFLTCFSWSAFSSRLEQDPVHVSGVLSLCPFSFSVLSPGNLSFLTFWAPESACSAPGGGQAPPGLPLAVPGGKLPAERAGSTAGSLRGLPVSGPAVLCCLVS